MNRILIYSIIFPYRSTGESVNGCVFYMTAGQSDCDRACCLTFTLCFKDIMASGRLTVFLLSLRYLSTGVNMSWSSATDTQTH